MESEEADDSLHLDDLQGLRAELEELQAALGEDYVAVRRGEAGVWCALALRRLLLAPLTLSTAARHVQCS